MMTVPFLFLSNKKNLHVCVCVDGKTKLTELPELPDVIIELMNQLMRNGTVEAFAMFKDIFFVLIGNKSMFI